MNIDDKLDDILDFCENCMRNNNLKELNDYLGLHIKEIQQDRHITSDKLCIWSSYLTFTLPVKSKLSSRPELYELVKSKAIEFEGELKAKKFMQGLK